MVLPIRVSGKTGRGEKLQEYTKTVEVGHYGIKFGLKSSLRPRQRIRIQNVRKHAEAPFRVVGQIPGPDAAVKFWGAECLDPSPGFWGINFPPVEQIQDATTRILLQCRKCKTQAGSYLSDLETEAFALTKRAVLFCDTCRRWTRWLTPRPGPEAGTPRSILPAKEVEKRANRRLPLEMVACLQSHKGNEEVVKSVDISKGGLAVLSKKSYPKDSFLKVAFPYTEGGGNIFILARVERVLTTEEPGVFLYGIQFLHGTFPEAKGL